MTAKEIADAACATDNPFQAMVLWGMYENAVLHETFAYPMITGVSAPGSDDDAAGR